VKYVQRLVQNDLWWVKEWQVHFILQVHCLCDREQVVVMLSKLKITHASRLVNTMRYKFCLHQCKLLQGDTVYWAVQVATEEDILVFIY
jgi:hypothetical protein